MLSDACFDFLNTVTEAAEELAHAAHQWATPGLTTRYGEEVDALRRASSKAAQHPVDVEAMADLLRLASAVLKFHDTPPETEHWREHESAMLALVALLRPSLNGHEASCVATMVKDAGKEGPAGAKAANWLSEVLPRLGKPAYDTAIKIISDIGSATVKRLLGL